MKIFIGLIMGFIISLYFMGFVSHNKYKDRIPNEIKPDYTILSDTNVIYWIKYYELKYPEIVYQQIMLESAYLKSNVCITKNNLLGLMDSKTTYYKFKHFTECLLFYKYRIQNRMLKSDKDYYSFLKRIKYSQDRLYLFKLKTMVNDKR